MMFLAGGMPKARGDMAQFDVYRNPFGSKRNSPFVIELQNDILSELGLVVVAPLKPRRQVKPARHLNPMLMIETGEYVFVPTELVSIRSSALDVPVMSLASERYAILRALDFMFTGV